MNEYTDTPIGTNLTVPFRLASAYNTEGKISIVDWTTNVVSDFPWMAFLKEETDLTLQTSTHIVGVSTTDVEYHMHIIVSDALGFHMIEESAKLIYGNEAMFHEWNKLPVSLSWLYGDKPYMTSVDIAPIMNDLHHAIDTGEASSSLYSYIETHSYRSPRSVTAFGSYSLYFEDNMVEPHGKASTINLKLGIEKFPNKEDISHTHVDDTITLDSNSSEVLEVVLQQRIGNYVSGQTLYIIADEILSEINLTVDTLVGTSHSTDIDNIKRFKVILSTLYNQTTRFPIWTETDNITCERSTGITLLTSNEGIINAPAVKLRTAATVIESGVDTIALSTSVLMLDDKLIVVGPIVDSVVFAEYEIIAL